MKTIVLAAILALASIVTSRAADITAIWTASPSTNVTYKVYGSPLSAGTLTFANRLSAPLQVVVGTNLTAVLSSITVTPFQLAVTATRSGLESQLSNVYLISEPLPPTDVRVGP